MVIREPHATCWARPARAALLQARKAGFVYADVAALENGDARVIDEQRAANIVVNLQQLKAQIQVINISFSLILGTISKRSLLTVYNYPFLVNEATPFVFPVLSVTHTRDDNQSHSNVSIAVLLISIACTVHINELFVSVHT